jgi:hypothetical protein
MRLRPVIVAVSAFLLTPSVCGAIKLGSSGFRSLETSRQACRAEGFDDPPRRQPDTGVDRYSPRRPPRLLQLWQRHVAHDRRTGRQTWPRSGASTRDSTFTGTSTRGQRRRLSVPSFSVGRPLRRVFEFDVLACPDCGGRLRLVATIENPSVVARILEHLGLAVDLSSPAPARSTEWLPDWSD